MTLPARNEEAALPRCLQGLSRQVDLEGRPLAPGSFEVLLLLNNTTDRSAEAVRQWQATHPELRLHLVERVFPVTEAHAGTARRLLMDTAWLRLRQAAVRPAAILATDADSVVAEDWVTQNLRVLEDGADVVGGELSLIEEDLRGLPKAVQHCYERDRCYAALVARLEDALDPQEGDRCPRHVDHFGASLACTPEAYAAAGGMPTVERLEDEAFVDRARRANLRLRHSPEVRVCTSARLNGRATVGMAGQLRMWSELPNAEAHCVPSAKLLMFRFQFLRELRAMFARKALKSAVLPGAYWCDRVEEALRTEETCPGFLERVDCDTMIYVTFSGLREQPVLEAIREMEAYLSLQSRQ